MGIALQNRQRTYRLNTERVIQWARQILTLQKCPEAEVGLCFVNDRRMREYNRRYRGKDRPTNVLAFCAREGSEAAPRTARMDHVLGDVVIALPTLLAEAKQYGRGDEEHLLILLIHGLLHLLGYDHERSPQEARRMQRRERRIFKALWSGPAPTDM